MDIIGRSGDCILWLTSWAPLLVRNTVLEVPKSPQALPIWRDTPRISCTVRLHAEFSGRPMYQKNSKLHANWVLSVGGIEISSPQKTDSDTKSLVIYELTRQTAGEVWGREMLLAKTRKAKRLQANHPSLWVVYVALRDSASDRSATKTPSFFSKR